MGIYVLCSQLDCELTHSCKKHSLNQALDIVTCVISFNPPPFSMKVFMHRHCVWGRTALVLKDSDANACKGCLMKLHKGSTRLPSSWTACALYSCTQTGSEQGVKPRPLCAHQTAPCSIGLGLPAAINTFPFAGRHFGLPIQHLRLQLAKTAPVF